ncbi:small ubiquitin-related modifier, partial [Clonorchis sinensis]
MGDSAAATNKDPSSEHINLKVQGQEGSIVHFKIKKTTPLRKLMNAYCERMIRQDIRETAGEVVWCCCASRIS